MTNGIGNGNSSKLWDLISKIIFTLIIPFMMWTVYSMYEAKTSMALLKQSMETMSCEKREVHSAINLRIDKNEIKIDALISQYGDIKTLLFLMGKDNKDVAKYKELLNMAK